MKPQVRDAVLHALDLAAVRSWDAAKAVLESLDDPVAGRAFLLVAELERVEERRKRTLATVRHEMGNALAIVRANLEGITDGVLPQTPERVNGILESVASLSALLDDLQRSPEYHESVTVHLDVFNMCTLIGAQAAAIEGMSRAKHVRIAYDPCGRGYDACTTFRGDPARIGQILRNVLINAVRYTPPGGSVEIRCDRPDGELSILIRDSGTPIDASDLAHLFEHGYRGRNAKVPGTGLGLGVVAQLLDAIGGDVCLIENDAKGVAFAIRLPTIPLDMQPLLTP